jgi:hypothetical protein
LWIGVLIDDPPAGSSLLKERLAIDDLRLSDPFRGASRPGTPRVQDVDRFLRLSGRGVCGNLPSAGKTTIGLDQGGLVIERLPRDDLVGGGARGGRRLWPLHDFHRECKTAPSHSQSNEAKRRGFIHTIATPGKTVSFPITVLSRKKVKGGLFVTLQLSLRREY